ncbi:hypothetical protein LEP1GSC040_0189 [Leptospira santarosai str. 2000030832]|nr:hypothetical protein LEP1GSC040_0189 [Leptospira santarosai str. 2000030832]
MDRQKKSELKNRKATLKNREGISEKLRACLKAVRCRNSSREFNNNRMRPKTANYKRD